MLHNVQNEEAEDLMRKIEKEEERAQYEVDPALISRINYAEFKPSLCNVSIMWQNVVYGLFWKVISINPQAQSFWINPSLSTALMSTLQSGDLSVCHLVKFLSGISTLYVIKTLACEEKTSIHSGFLS